jgi:hypothetical protein
MDAMVEIRTSARDHDRRAKHQESIKAVSRANPIAMIPPWRNRNPRIREGDPAPRADPDALLKRLEDAEAPAPAGRS